MADQKITEGKLIFCEVLKRNFSHNCPATVQNCFNCSKKGHFEPVSRLEKQETGLFKDKKFE